MQFVSESHGVCWEGWSGQQMPGCSVPSAELLAENLLAAAPTEMPGMLAWER